LYAAQ
jgi:hypothetical protein